MFLKLLPFLPTCMEEYPLLSLPVDDSVVLLASDDDEDLRDDDGYVTDKVSLQSLISDRAATGFCQDFRFCLILCKKLIPGI